MDEEEKIKKRAKASSLFSPGAPINQYELFAGRLELVKDVVRGINQRGQHIILFGERGVGKTSLASVIREVFEQHAGFVIVNCDSQDNFSTIWRKVLKEIQMFSKKNVGLLGQEQVTSFKMEDLLDKEEIGPEDIRYVLQLINSNFIIIIDEVDRITDAKATTLMADTIKTISDHSLVPTILLVGVADSVEELIAEHLSIERALVQIRMPRMSQAELKEILDKAFVKLEMEIAEEAKEKIVKLSQGLPHFTHLLGLHAAEKAIDNNKDKVEADEVDEALQEAIKKAQATIIGAYKRATTSPKDSLYPQVLLSAALAKKDELGSFAAADIRGPMSTIMGRAYSIPAFARHLNDFCDSKRGPVLEKLGHPRRYRYRFINPMVEPFTIMHGLANGLISEETVTNIADENSKGKSKLT